MTTREILINAKKYKSYPSLLSDERRNETLTAMAASLEEHAEDILSANLEDIEAASNIGDVMKDRLRLTRERIRAMAEGIREVSLLPDPLGRVLKDSTRSDGLIIQKISVPMGVVAVIYESRPNVTSDAAAIALKSGNVAVLRCGKEAHRSCSAIVEALKDGLSSVGMPRELISLIEDTSKTSANELMTAVGYVDLLIPRGGGGLIRACVENARVPCIQTGMGICHIYIDKAADIEKAVSILENAKAGRPSVCNAAEVCLIHRDIAEKLLPIIRERLCIMREKAGKPPVELRLDKEALLFIPGRAAEDSDFDTEFLDYILSIKTVSGIDEAISHIEAHSTHHSEAIITEDMASAERFAAEVDSAAVYINASTRFTDGGEFGCGCEIGISTQKLHARGPMGIEELTSYKYVVRGNGHIR